MGDTEDGSGYQLIVSFPDQSESFAYGFEAGKIWAEMRRGDRAEIAETVRIENEELYRRMAIVLGWGAEIISSEVEGWVYLTLRKTGAPPARPNPVGLRLV